MTKQETEILLQAVKDYVSELLNGWGLTDEEKTLVSFEQTHLPYTRYSGNQSIDHIVFRRFLRLYDPQNIEDGIAGNVIAIYEERIKELESKNASLVEDNEELRKKLAEVEQLAFAGL